MAGSCGAALNARVVNYETPHMFPITTSVAAAAKAIGIGQTSLYSLIKNGQLKTIKIGRRRLVLIDSIRALLGDKEVR